MLVWGPVGQDLATLALQEGGESPSCPLAPLWIEAPSPVEGLPSTPHLVKMSILELQLASRL